MFLCSEGLRLPWASGEINKLWYISTKPSTLIRTHPVAKNRIPLRLSSAKTEPIVLCPWKVGGGTASGMAESRCLGSVVRDLSPPLGPVFLCADFILRWALSTCWQRWCFSALGFYLTGLIEISSSAILGTILGFESHWLILGPMPVTEAVTMASLSYVHSSALRAWGVARKKGSLLHLEWVSTL